MVGRLIVTLARADHEADASELRDRAAELRAKAPDLTSISRRIGAGIHRNPGRSRGLLCYRRRMPQDRKPEPKWLLLGAIIGTGVLAVLLWMVVKALAG
jgi:hypothetical protein